MTDSISRLFDDFAWGIDPWDTNKVETELKKRGLNPVADHHGSDYKSFRVKDPDGFDLAITNGTKANRRKGPATPKLKVTAAIGHISFGLENWDSQRVYDELVKRDVAYTTRDGKREPRIDNTGTLLSWHVPDAMGWDLQIGNKIKPGP
jgi:hypothetical protein